MISLGIFICSLAVLVLLIANAERLSRYGLLHLAYYLVLILMGLTAAIVLFGVLESKATWAGKILDGDLKLGGPVVCFALVVVGGIHFLPKETFFPLTVYVRGDEGPQDVVLRGAGRVFLKLGPEISSEPIGENGQAVFPRVPADFRGQQVPGWIESDDYEASNTTVTMASDNVDLIVKKKIKHFKLAGTVLDGRGNSLSDVRVALPAYSMVVKTDSDGRFEFQVIANREQIVDLTAAKPGYRTIRLSPTLGDSGVNFSLEGVGNATR